MTLKQEEASGAGFFQNIHKEMIQSMSMRHFIVCVLFMLNVSSHLCYQSLYTYWADVDESGTIFLL
jgi:hypothetical protein